AIRASGARASRRTPDARGSGARRHAPGIDEADDASGNRIAPVMTEARRVPRKRNVIASLRQPKVAVMLMLGFSSGLPFFLTGNTLGYWLRDEGTTLGAIGFLSWVGLAYSVKFLWAPVIDRVNAPVFGRFGRRRGWLMLNQLLVAIGLIGLSATGLKAGLASLGV